MTRWVVNLDEPDAGDARLVGGKAAELNRLIAAGLPVPAAFVVTTEAFHAHLGAASLHERPDDVRLEGELIRAMETAVAAVFQPGVSLAVRSSALGEDGARASFAGQHETYYFISPDELDEAVKHCWLSLWSPQARSYRSRHRGGDGFAMAVVVQRMVKADRSGVCFTVDPTGRHPECVCIEAVWGLGAALVDGRVSPDRLLLDRSGGILRRHIARKRHKVAAVPDGPRMPRLEAVPSSRQTRPVLSDARAMEVLRASLEAERVCGSPQDVEWSFEGGSLQVLQSRPITTLPASCSPPALPHRGEWVLFKPLAENFTEPLTPMTVDLFRRVLPPFGRFIDGRYYLSLDVARRLCPFHFSKRELVDVLLLRGRMPALRWNWRKLPLAAAGAAAAYLLDGIAWHRTAHLTRESLAEYALLCQRLSAAPRLDVPAMLHRLVLGRHPFEPIGRMAYYVNVSAGRYFLLLGMLTKLAERYAPELDRHLLASLCSGDGGTFSRALVEGVRELAQVARQDPDLTRRLTSNDPRALADAVSSLAESHPFVLALEAFLAGFGHRCMREMELAVPRWREDPLPLLLMVRGYLRSPATPPTDPHALHLLARDALRRALPRAWQRRLAGYLVGRVRYYTSLREDTRHYHAMAMDVIRDRLLDMEQALLADGRLRLPGDVFYLTWEEARALAEQRLRWEDVAARVRQRRRHERVIARAEVPEVVSAHTVSDTDSTGSDPPTADGGYDAAGAGGCGAAGTRGYTVLAGQCASPGTAEGRVRLVFDPAAANDLEAGDVLVAPYTDPAWTPLFPLAAAVVVEVGSFLSHAGTVAREYGIPCLVDVADCTGRLREGQRVRVLASEGRLEVID